MALELTNVITDHAHYPKTGDRRASFHDHFLYCDADFLYSLSWAHYGSVLPRLWLWYVSLAVVSILTTGLLAIAFDRRWGAWLLLASTTSAFILVPFSGVSIFSATARLFGGIATACIFSILSLTFLVRDES